MEPAYLLLYSEATHQFPKLRHMSHLQEPLSASLWKPNKRGLHPLALALYNNLVDYCTIDNSEANQSSKGEKLKTIKTIVGKSEELNYEIYLQLIKLTNGNCNIVQVLNAWQLFAQVIQQDIRCPAVNSHYLPLSE